MNQKLFLSIAALLALTVWTSGCWDADNPLRAGQAKPSASSRPAHNVNLGGARHASGYCQPFLNCVPCHGDSLQGDSLGRPSCTSCHSDHWNEPGCETISHTVDLDGRLHAPGYCQPLLNCARCHGATLRGGTAGQPSCYSCHDAKWSDRECGD